MFFLFTSALFFPHFLFPLFKLTLIPSNFAYPIFHIHVFSLTGCQSDTTIYHSLFSLSSSTRSSEAVHLSCLLNLWKLILYPRINITAFLDVLLYSTNVLYFLFKFSNRIYKFNLICNAGTTDVWNMNEFPGGNWTWE